MADPDSKVKPVDSAHSDSHAIGSFWRASEVIGTDVKNAGDEGIGKVEDLVVDVKSGEVLAIVISTGGFLGMGEHLSSVPPSALRYDTDARAFKTKLTKEQLGAAPGHKKGDAPEDHETMVAKLRAFRDSIGGDVSKPDNTAHNEGELSDATTSVLEQGNSERDLGATKSIRTAIIDHDNLSFNAKNVKIITKDGKVTLRGVVNSKDEHERIVEVANDQVGKENVTDQLQVKND